MYMHQGQWVEGVDSLPSIIKGTCALGAVALIPNAASLTRALFYTRAWDMTRDHSQGLL